METLPVEMIPLDDIVLLKEWPVIRGELYHNEHISFLEKVGEYMDLLSDGAIFPPIVIDKNNQIFDGECRYYAHFLMDRKKIMCMRKHED